MKTRILIISALLLGSSFGAEAQGLGIDGEEATSVGIYVKSLSDGKVLIDHNSQMALTPASVMKAVTTATALSINGCDSCFATRVGYSGSIEGHNLKGNVVIQASADPTLESENFKSRLGFCDSVAAHLKMLGISEIEGSVVVNQSLKNPGPNLAWEIEDVAWPYGAALFGFNWRDNYATLAPATGEVDPEVPGLEVCIEDAKHNDIVRGIYSDRLMVFTRDRKDKNWRVNFTVPDPSAVFVCEMCKKLRAKGIKVSDEPVGSHGFTPVYTHRSIRFGEIMKSLMVRSDNLFAEGMLRSIAPEGFRKDAVAREKELWNSRGVSAKYTIINDGSGLARSNRISPSFLAGVLEYMAKSPMSREYASYFPRAGKDGTMRGFLPKSPLKGKIALKTGSVSSVQCYAGYKLDAQGNPTHIIVIMVNGFFCPRKEVREASEKLLEQLFF